MSSNERRERLLQILKKSDEPVKGSELSAELQVSRQVVVKDIALLRASGIEILATSSGYIILNPVKDEFKIKCKNHNSDEELYDELQTIIDLGGRVKNSWKKQQQMNLNNYLFYLQTIIFILLKLVTKIYLKK